MINLLPRYLFNFVMLILLQVLLLNNLQFSGYVNPYLYVLFIITLPFSTPKWLLLVLGFITAHHRCFHEYLGTACFSNGFHGFPEAFHTQLIFSERRL